MPNFELDFDLETILQGKTTSQLYSKADKIYDYLFAHKKDYFANVELFLKYHSEEKEVEIIMNRLGNYFSNHAQKNVLDPKWEQEQRKLGIYHRQQSERFADATNIILKNIDQIRKILEDPRVSYLKLHYERIFRLKNHILPDDQNLLLTKISRGFGAPADLFSILTNGEFKFEPAMSTKGKKLPVTHGNYPVLMKNKDREVRRTAHLSYWTEYNEHKKTLANALYYEMVSSNDLAKIHHHDDHVASALFEDELTKDFVLKLYCEVKKFMPLIRKYLNLKKRAIKSFFKLEKVESYDMGLDFGKTTRHFSIPEAKEIIMSAFEFLGTEYQTQITKALNERWIDWLPAKGKYSGAYSIGQSYGLDKKYILMNYNETLESVSTLAHELGHSLHSYFSDNNQPAEYAEYPILQAEVASITNELILNKWLLKKFKNDKILQLTILKNFLDEFVGIVPRQTLLSEYEYTVSDRIAHNEPLSFENMEEIYVGLQKEYFGKTNKIGHLQNVDCVRIPHFYYNFYVYKYVIGILGAVSIFEQLNSNQEKGISMLLSYLKAGSSSSPTEILKIIGFDIDNPLTFERGRRLFKRYLNNFQTLLQEMKLV